MVRGFLERQLLVRPQLAVTTHHIPSHYKDPRFHGGPSHGRGWPNRILSELREAIHSKPRAAADHTTTSEIMREAIRRFLEVA